MNTTDILDPEGWNTPIQYEGNVNLDRFIAVMAIVGVVATVKYGKKVYFRMIEKIDERRSSDK